MSSINHLLFFKLAMKSSYLVLFLSVINLSSCQDIEAVNLRLENLYNIVMENAESIKEIEDLREQNIKQSLEITELKKEIQELININREQDTKLNQLDQALVEIQQQLPQTTTSINIEAQVHTFQTTPIAQPVTTAPVATTLYKWEEISNSTNHTSNIPITSGADKCNMNVNGTCYWVEAVPRGIYYSTAVAICKKYNATLVLIPDDETYNGVVNLMRQKLPAGWTGTNSWTGIKFDPKTGKHSPPDTYTKWLSGHPYKITGWTNVFLQIRRNPTDYSQGLGNFKPSDMSGFICQFEHL
uniref:uncharacterized protein LOC120333200 n=1 Tax=Styela clava TaxID=7725 RepID=UPI00193A2223|nr:uncharacterized protein LOC120333200 [Styela clava]